VSVIAHPDYRICDALPPDFPSRFAHRRIQLGLEAEITDTINQWRGPMPNRIDAHRIGAMIPTGFLALRATAVCAMLAVVFLPNGSTRAATDCSAAPTSQPPPGSHWYYRVEKQRHCWYLGPEGQRVRHAEPEAQPAAKPAASARAETAGDRLMGSAQVEPPPPSQRPDTAADTTAQTFVQGSEQGSRPETLSTTVQLPDALQPAGASDSEPAYTSTPQDVDPEAAVAPPAVAVAANARTAMLMRVLLLIAGALAVAGIFQHAIFRVMMARRRQISVERARAKLSSTLARQPTPPAFAAAGPNGLKRAAVEPIDPRDIQEGFRQILRAVERRAA
jgi:hypothetical protein